MKALAIEFLTGPAFSLVTLLFGFLIGHRLAIGRDKRNEFSKAAATFRDAFLPEIIFLRHNANIPGSSASGDVGQKLSYGHLHRHLKAFEVFRDYLSTKKKAGLDKAWQKYCYNADNQKTLCFNQYSRKVALERIEEILKFAKPLK